MSRPSEPLLVWLRQMSEERGLNTAALATRANLPRSRIRKVLGGKAAMTVDELLLISDALDLSPSDMGVPMGEANLADPQPEGPRLADPPNVAKPPERLAIDPWDSHHRQLLEVAFLLGCDFGFTVHTDQIADSGVPKRVLDAHKDGMMLIQLDAAYHRYNNPRYDEDSIKLTLSFDSLYECRFPWSAIHQVIFTPMVEGPEEMDDTGHPKLRLVT